MFFFKRSEKQVNIEKKLFSGKIYPKINTGKTRPKIILTVDIEALCARAEDNHFDKLIWGNFGGTNFGIGKMMDIAEKYGVSLTCFLDLCGYERYGQRLIDTAKIIIDRGHDLQLLAHPSQITIDIWKNYGLKQQPNLFAADIKSADAVFKYIFEVYSKIKSCNLPIKDPIAFRGGAYKFNKAILDKMLEYNIKISSNYNREHIGKLLNFENIPQFRWSNGTLELPISNLQYTHKANYWSFNFSSYVFDSCGTKCKRGINNFLKMFGNDAILVFIMHSWSFLSDSNNFYLPLDSKKKMMIFDEFLKNITRKFNVVTASDIHELNNKAQLACFAEKDTLLIDRFTSLA